MAKIINIDAMQKWNEFPKDFQKQLLDNVFCGKCFVTTIVDYDITLTNDGFVLLKGKCKKCSGNVARVVN
ncbi:MAG: hypothetical protein FWE25_09225 [Lachnospiraceae bacterium]|nr:hypothetical protein [Lachnospiraceae bacterium]